MWMFLQRNVLKGERRIHQAKSQSFWEANSFSVWVLRTPLRMFQIVYVPIEPGQGNLCSCTLCVVLMYYSRRYWQLLGGLGIAAKATFCAIRGHTAVSVASYLASTLLAISITSSKLTNRLSCLKYHCPFCA